MNLLKANPEVRNAAIPSFIALVLICCPAAAQLSTSKLIDYGKYYGNQDEAVMPSERLNPLIYRDDFYWTIYLTPQDSTTVKNLIIIVRQVGDGGTMETREDVLRLLYGLDYDLDSLELASQKGIGLGGLRNVMQSVKSQLESDGILLENIKRQSDEDFQGIEDELREAQAGADDALVILQEGTDYLDAFLAAGSEQEVVFDDLELVMEKYDDSLDAIFGFSGAADKYQKAVIGKQLEIEDAAIASELSKLANLKVEDALFKSYNASLSQKRKEYDVRNAKKERAVNDYIYSLYSRKQKVEATSAYDGAKDEGIIDTLLSPRNSAVLKECGVNAAELKRRWSAIETSMELQEYELVPLKVLEASEIAQNLNTKLTDCLAATPKPTASPSGFDAGKYAAPAAFIILLAIAFLYFNNYFRKKNEETDQ